MVNWRDTYIENPTNTDLVVAIVMHARTGATMWINAWYDPEDKEWVYSLNEKYKDDAQHMIISDWAHLSEFDDEFAAKVRAAGKPPKR